MLRIASSLRGGELFLAAVASDVIDRDVRRDVRSGCVAAVVTSLVAVCLGPFRRAHELSLFRLCVRLCITSLRRPIAKKIRAQKHRA